MRSKPLRMAVVAFASCLAAGGCRLASKPGAYEATYDVVEFPKRTLDVTYVTPLTARAPATLVIFATGDAGWTGASREVFEHMADEGYYLAGLDSRKLVARNRKSGERETIADAAGGLESAFARAKRTFGLPGNVPVIVVGDSRGATFTIFAAAEKHLRAQIAGAVAIALTREADYLQAPPPAERDPAVQVDAKGRILIYPVLTRLDSIPIAVIQSTNDRYVPSAEARRLMGPDTAMRRLYEVKSRNHGFGGGRDRLLADLDDALTWIETTVAK